MPVLWIYDAPFYTLKLFFFLVGPWFFVFIINNFRDDVLKGVYGLFAYAFFHEHSDFMYRS